ncbi:MAG: NAD-dependent epimerase/dehydratase family protein [Ignavibacteria bacterium]|nr:NAD-dependent epimerase/dehydratase family protein [Ignavibacteria bacterium]
MNILITGGAGFIASHIADANIRRRNKVFILDNLSSGDKGNINPRAKFYKKDIYKDNLEKIFRDNKIDVINHHAAQIDLRKSQTEPIFDARINIEGSLNLLKLAVKYKVRKVVFASSGGAVYGEQEYFPADEKHKTEPLSPYGISKLTVEKYLEFFRSYYGIKYVCLRYSNVFGPRQSMKGEAGVVSVFYKKILAGKNPVINGDGNQTRDYVFVDDVVKANLLAQSYRGSGIFNICTGRETSVNQLFRLINKNLNNRAEEVHGSGIYGEQVRSVLSNKLAGKKLLWKPETGIKAGIIKTGDWFKKYF